MIHKCTPCEKGDHENCRGSTTTKKGHFGGSKCICHCRETQDWDTENLESWPSTIGPILENLQLLEPLVMNESERGKSLKVHVDEAVKAYEDLTNADDFALSITPTAFSLQESGFVNTTDPTSKTGQYLKAAILDIVQEHKEDVLKCAAAKAWLELGDAGLNSVSVRE